MFSSCVDEDSGHLGYYAMSTGRYEGKWNEYFNKDVEKLRLLCAAVAKAGY